MLLFWIIYNIQYLVDDVRLIVIINCYDLIKKIYIHIWYLCMLCTSHYKPNSTHFFSSHMYIYDWINGKYVLYNFVFCNHFLVDIFHFAVIHQRWRWSADCLFIKVVWLLLLFMMWSHIHATFMIFITFLFYDYSWCLA